MKVLLASAWGEGRALDAMRRAAQLDRFAVHAVTEDADEADIILFLDMVHFEDLGFRRVLEHPFVRAHREKCFLYNEADRPWCVMPGLYCSMPKRAFQPSRQKAVNYLYTMNTQLDGVAAKERRWLYSFMGSANHTSRKRILKLVDARAVLEDTSTFNIWVKGHHDDMEARQRRYAEVLTQSAYVLCPRGAGTSSYRLFETMKIGVAPVLVSDQWVAPDGPDWDSFMFRVPESDVAELPKLLRDHEHEAVDRGIRARMAYEQWFAPPVQFHRVVEWCHELLLKRTVPESVARFTPSLERPRARTRMLLHEARAAVRKRFGR